jgi:cobalt-zinc-cadmium efflux system outer membrane protein
MLMIFLNPRGAGLLLCLLLGHQTQALAQGSQPENSHALGAPAALSEPAAVAGQALEVLSIESVVDRVLARQSDLRLAALAVDGAQAAVATAKSLPNPRVDWQTGRYRPFPSGQAGDTAAWVVAQPIENPWMRQARRAAAEAGVDVARQQRDVLRNDVVARTRSLVVELGLRQLEVQAFAEAVTLLEQVRDRVRRRVDVGEAARYDLIKSDAELVVARQRFQQSRLQVDQVRLALNRLAAGGLPASWSPAPGAVLEAHELMTMQIRERGLDGNPELDLLQQVTRQAAAGLDQARASVWPSVDVVGNRSREPDVRQASVGLSLTVPIWDRRKGPIAQAQVELSRSQSALEGRRAELVQELKMARTGHEMAQARVRALSQGALAEAEAAVRVAEAAWRFGERGILDVLDAQRILRTLRADLIQARLEAQVALIEIERLEGRYAVSAS